MDDETGEQRARDCLRCGGMSGCLDCGEVNGLGPHRRPMRNRRPRQWAELRVREAFRIEWLPDGTYITDLPLADRMVRSVPEGITIDVYLQPEVHMLHINVEVEF